MSSDAITARAAEHDSLEAQVRELMLRIPNLPHESAPDGGEDDAVEVRTWGLPPTFDFEVRDKEIMQALAIPYRVVNIATGDLGQPAAKKYDVEGWMPGQAAYREVTSCSNCTDYQARRLTTRIKTPDGPAFVHTLNGTAVAVGRTIIAILENNQPADGGVHIPHALVSYTGFELLGPTEP